LKNGVVLNLTSEGYVRRRDFIKVIAGSAAWPLAASALQTSDPPVIGVLLPLLAAATSNVEALRSGLQDLGYFEGRNYFPRPKIPATTSLTISSMR
jgi:hypothetical protein